MPVMVDVIEQKGNKLGDLLSVHRRFAQIKCISVPVGAGCCVGERSLKTVNLPELSAAAETSAGHLN